MVIITVNLTTTVSATMEWLTGTITGDDQVYRILAIIFGSITGLGVGISRFNNRKLLQQLKEKLFKKKKNTDDKTGLISINEEETDDDITFIGEYFDSITRKVIF